MISKSFASIVCLVCIAFILFLFNNDDSVLKKHMLLHIKNVVNERHHNVSSSWNINISDIRQFPGWGEIGHNNEVFSNNNTLQSKNNTNSRSVFNNNDSSVLKKDMSLYINNYVNERYHNVLSSWDINMSGITPFPRWGEVGDDNEEFSNNNTLRNKNNTSIRSIINVDALIQLMNDIVHNFDNTIITFVNRTSSAQLYIIDRTGIYTSRSLRRRSINKSEYERFDKSEHGMLLAYNSFFNNYTESYRKSKWPYLYNLINASNSNVTDGYGFPFLFWYGDYTQCSHQHFYTLSWNNNTNVSVQTPVPLFTCSANLGNACNHAIPFPNYEILRSSKVSSQEWISTFQENKATYTNQLQKIVWRGSLTGHSNLQKNSRWKMIQYIDQQNNTDLFDVGVVSIPKSILARGYNNITTVPRITKNDYQKYVAVLDIDGNSWSSRFASLLCSNSVVLKVQPVQVDYYFVNDHVMPWKHYIPIRNDFSDLIENAQYVLSHPDHVQQIIQSANEWCSTHLIDEAISHDMLDVWNGYLSYFGTTSTTKNGWQDVWLTAKKNIFENKTSCLTGTTSTNNCPSYEMERLPISL